MPVVWEGQKQQFYQNQFLPTLLYLYLQNKVFLKRKMYQCILIISVCNVHTLLNLPFNVNGMASDWIFVGDFHFKSSHALHNVSTIPYE